jgi:hypothetical protein
MPKQSRAKQLDPFSVAGAMQHLVPNAEFRAVTPSDTVAIKDGPCRSLYVGGAGDVSAQNENDAEVIFFGVPAGTVLPIVTGRVNATNTTATHIVAL